MDTSPYQGDCTDHVRTAQEWCTLPESHVYVSKRLQECNYLQAMERGIDTSHVSYVHRYEVDVDPIHQRSKALDYIKADGNVSFEIEKTPFGLTIYGRRNGEPDSYYWRVTQWLFPWFTLIPPFGEHSLAAHVWVPIDDYNCWAWTVNFRPERPLGEDELRDMKAGKGLHCQYEPGTFRTKANKDNDYLIDRKSQKEKRSFSGVSGFAVQDSSLQESMGPIQNLEREKLLPTDRAIVMAAGCCMTQPSLWKRIRTRRLSMPISSVFVPPVSFCRTAKNPRSGRRCIWLMAEAAGIFAVGC